MPSAKSFRPEIFLVSLAAILLEIGYTRVFSYKLHYYFTYLTIGISLLGLGSGGVFVAVMPWLRRLRPERVVAGCCLLGGLAVPIGYQVVAAVQLNAIDIADDPVELLTLVLLCTMVFLPFLLVGVAIATIFGARAEDIPRLYFADLIGAGIGCAVCVPLFGSITPPGTIVLGGAILALSGAHSSRGEWRAGPLAGALLGSACLAGAVLPDRLPDPVVDRGKTNSPQWMKTVPFEFTRWSTVFRIDVFEGFGAHDERKSLSHDGNLGSNLIRFDGDFSKLRHLDADVRSTPYSVLGPEPEVLIIGAAGGHEILASLYFGAGHVTAVELNPVTVSLLRDHYAEYTGNIARHPRVTLVNGEGRSFVERDDSRYDLIWFVAPDSYAAMNAASSAAFVLSESYLYTVEMIQDALAHLKPGGLLCLQTGDIDFGKKPNRAARYLSTARAALAGLGIRDFDRHVLVSSVPEFFTMVTILVSPEPIEAARIERFFEKQETTNFLGKRATVWHPRRPGAPIEHPVQAVVSLPEDQLEAWKARYPYVLSPVTDDSPFFWHFTSFARSLAGASDADDAIFDPEDAKGERVLLALLAFVVVYAGVFLLLPLVALRDVWRRIPYKKNALLYFAALGLGFMFFEISLIQKLTLFLGYPSYSLTVTLFSILVFSGIGSLLSERYGDGRRALGTLLAALVVLTGLYQLGLTPLVDALVGSPFPVRVAVTVGLLAPLGLCLGAFMPIGLATVAKLSEHGREYVAWAWAVNGFFSVVASVAATMLSMTFGFRAVIYLALGIYLLGAAALARVPRRAPGA